MPDIQLNNAILRCVIIQTEPQTILVRIKERRRPSGRTSIFSCFFNTFIKGNVGVKLRRNEVNAPNEENISAMSTI